MAVVGSDCRIFSPPFTDLDETPEDTVSVPTVAVASLLSGALPSPTSEAVPDTTGLYRATLTAGDHLSAVDLLTVVWTGTVSGASRALTTSVDVAGGAYVPTDALIGQRSLLSAGATVDDARLWRDVFERLAESARGVAFVPRLATHSVPGDGRTVAALQHHRVRELVAVWVDGVAGDLSDYELLPNGMVKGSFTATTKFAFTHGYDSPPPALVAACKDYVRAKLLAGTSDQAKNVISFTDRVSGETYRYGTADWRAGRFTGMESVDSLISSVPDESIPATA